MNPRRKKLLLLTTGGTIASLPGNSHQTHFSAEQLLAQMEPLQAFYDLHAQECFRQDSVHVQPEQWQALARRIDGVHPDYDGIVVTHGTDTMAYTASMLALMLRGIPIPVVLTGAQRPMIYPESDGLSNLRCACAMAASRVGGVFLAFHNQVLLGSHAVKTRSVRFAAFESVGAPCAAMLGAHGLLVHKDKIPAPEDGYRLRDALCDRVFLWKLCPSSRPELADFLIHEGMRGVVLEGYGKGGLPQHDPGWCGALDKLREHGIPVVLCGQCQLETDPQAPPEDLPVIFARGMTTEAAVTTLMWSLGQLLQAGEPDGHLVEKTAEWFRACAGW